MAETTSNVESQKEDLEKASGGGEVELTEKRNNGTTNNDKDGRPLLQQEPPPSTSTKSSSLAREVLFDYGATLVVGFFTVSFWRGTWTLLDIWDCGQDPHADVEESLIFCNMADVLNEDRRDSGWRTYWISVILIVVGVVLLWAGLWRPTKQQEENNKQAKVTIWRAIVRFLILYILGWAAVCMWRGIWYLVDYYILTDDIVKSWWTTTVAGLGGLYLLCAGASALAPPAIFILDGPSLDSPPVGITLLTSYLDITRPAHQTPPQLPRLIYVIDVLLSFFGVPILVVFYWRGCWGLMDQYLWGLGVDRSAVVNSIGYSALIGVFGLILASDDIMSLVKTKHKLVLNIVVRLRTLVLAIAAVNVWRAVWYTWDVFMATGSHASAWLSHWLGCGCLLLMGCMSCITAPPSTIGVDALAHPECADEPLFHNVAIPAEALYFMAIGRQPLELQEGQHNTIEQLDQISDHALQKFYQWQRSLGRPPRPTASTASAAASGSVAAVSSISSLKSSRTISQRGSSELFRSR